ncbi:MAG: hypothetical protein L3K16_08455 [Thermoplasmata archaeon]|nr:hypothetical protein [Thermoplasmata archaeon]
MPSNSTLAARHRPARPGRAPPLADGADGPREVTLGFALGVDGGGQPRELPDTVVLATILASVEAERSGLSQRLHLGPTEAVEAVANVYWPLVVLPAPTPGRVAIFDGTGVWRRTFRYSLLPPLAPLHATLERPGTPVELLTTLEGLRPRFAEDPGAEVLAVEGFLPVDPPLLFDVLAQAEFRREPQSPHPGFLPARHDLPWYAAAVEQMGRWLDRFGADLQQLETLKAAVAGRLGGALVDSDAETDAIRADGKRRLDRGLHELTRESDRLHAAVQAEVRREAEVVRLGQATVARGNIEQRTADVLAARSLDRGSDAAGHQVRGRRAAAEVRDAHRAIRESLERLEALHERERAAVVALTGRVTAVEHAEAERLAERELFRDQLSGVGNQVVTALDGHLAARSLQRDVLQQYFLAPTAPPSVRVIWFPLWVALLRGPRGLRASVFPPMRLRSGHDLGSALKGLFGGAVLPLEPRTAQFDGALRRTLEEALATDPWLAHAAFEIVRGADVLVDPDLPMRFRTGLRELEQAGWIGAKASRRLDSAYEEIVHDRFTATGGATEPSALESTAPVSHRRPPAAIA